MLISLNEIKKYVKIPEDMTSEALIELIGSRLVEIEEVHDLAPKYKGSYIIKVVSCEDIPGTHLHLCQIDAGEHTQEFSDGETVQIVCGAPNVRAGMLAVWLAPASIVPSTFGNENFKLQKRKLQGYESTGMLAGADELDFDTEHKAIAEIDPKLIVTDPESGESRPVRAGDSLANAFDLNDIILDVENKSLTHRPDCFGLIGFAREIAGILGQKFTEPDWLSLAGPASAANNDLLSIEVDPAICPRYSCAVFDLPSNTPSKFLTKDAVFLAKAGMRAIDPMVDLTNIIMLQTGQPLHAFDFDKLVAVAKSKSPKATTKIIVRTAKPGEELQLLDGKTIQCIPEDILITANDTPVALAGAMGGKNTEIDASTRRVVLESATFSLYHLRKTQMAHGIFSEAITRFTKGQPAAMTLPVLSEAIRRFGVTPLAVTDVYPDPVKPSAIKLSLDQINHLLGSNYDAKTVTTTLENVGFVVESAAGEFSVTAPVWRTDIHLPEDVIEEIGRLLGFDNIPLALPKKPFSGTEAASSFTFKTRSRAFLSDSLRMHELLTYSFVSRALLEKVGQDPDNSYQIVNSISPELQSFRQHIVPSLLDKVRENLKSGHQDFTLYELNQVSVKSDGLSEESTPVMHNHLGIVSLGDFYLLKSQLLAYFQRGIHLPLAYSKMSAATAKTYPYLEPVRSAQIMLKDQVIGAFGELRASVLRNFKLSDAVSACGLTLDPLFDLPENHQKKIQLSRFPSVERDLTISVPATAEFGKFDQAIIAALDKTSLIYSVTPVSIYQSSSESATKNLSFRLRFSDPQKTLRAQEISDIMEKIVTEVGLLGASVV